MSYLSDIRLVFYTMDTNKLPYGAIKLWFDENFPHEEAVNWCAGIEHGEDYIYVSYHDVKWYPSYDHPHRVELAIQSFVDCFITEEEGTDAAYEFVELGEEVEDIQVRSSAYSVFRLRVVRDIEFE